MNPLHTTLLLLALALPTLARSVTLTVGPGDAPMSLAQALAQAADDDVIELLPGRYAVEPMLLTGKRLTLRGGGERPVLAARGPLTAAAIWTVRDAQITLENLEFTGARSAQANGAGVRLDSGRLTVRRCAFFDNEVGIVTANDPKAELVVEDSEFGRTPPEVGGLYHQLHAGRIASLSIRGSRFHRGFEGHLIKSRARVTRIAYNLIYDGAGGGASYEVDLPNGGDAILIGNIVGQGRGTQNPVVISYGSEGRVWDRNRLLLAHNTLISDYPWAWFLRAWIDNLVPGASVRAVNNLTVGLGVFTLGSSGRFDGNWPALASALEDPSTLAFELRNDSFLRGRAEDPGALAGDEALPTAEFMPPIGTRPLKPPARWSPGALQR